MALQNIVETSALFGKSLYKVIDTSGTLLVQNLYDRVIKLNVLNITNTSDHEVDVTVKVIENYGNANIVTSVTVAPNSTIPVVDGNSSLYIQKGAQVLLYASEADILHGFGSWEEVIAPDVGLTFSPEERATLLGKSHEINGGIIIIASGHRPT